MNLNSQQKEEIEWYLLGQGLTIKRFYDEVLDHFICKVEDEMKDDIGFNEAFYRAKAFFHDSRDHKPWWPFPQYGLKGMEKKYLQTLSLSSFHFINLDFKKQFRVSFFIVLLFTALFAGLVRYFEVQMTWAFIPIFFLVFVSLLVSAGVYSFGYTKKRNRYYKERGNLEVIKSKQLESFLDWYIYPFFLGFPFLVLFFLRRVIDDWLVSSIAVDIFDFFQHWWTLVAIVLMISFGFKLTKYLLKYEKA